MSTRSIQIAGRNITIHESADTYDPSTGRALTGSWLWDSALHLAEWIAAADLSGATVLELGAGLGLPGLAAAVLGSSRVVLTDAPPLLEGLRRNVEANGVGEKVEVRELRWGSDEAEVFGSEVGEVDVVLMSDLFYDPEEMGGLGRVLRAVWGDRTKGWAASEVREGMMECLEALKAEGFKVEEKSVVRRRLMRSPEESAVFAVFIIYRD